VSFTGEIKADAPVLMVRGVATRYARHEVPLTANRLMRVHLKSPQKEFDPIIECRPVDGAPNEVVRCDNVRGLGDDAQLDLLPARAGAWLIYVGDAKGRPGPYQLDIEPVAERRILQASGTVEEALTGTEHPATVICPVQAGRRYRAKVSAHGFPPYFLVAGPGAAPARAADDEVIFPAARSGQAVLQVSSLSLASGGFEVEVVELW
jgi:hypothetical protein